MSKFLQENSELLIVSDIGRIVWKGSPFNWAVMKIIEIPNGEAAIILLDYYKWNTTQGFNLVCVNENGSVDWQAFEKSGQFADELITDIQIKDGQYVVNTWNGCRLILDEKTGQMAFLTFTK